MTVRESLDQGLAKAKQAGEFLQQLTLDVCHLHGVGVPPADSRCAKELYDYRSHLPQLVEQIKSPSQAYLVVDSAQHFIAGAVHLRHFVVGRNAQTKSAIKRVRQALEEHGADSRTIVRLERPGGMRVDVVHFYYSAAHFYMSYVSGLLALGGSFQADSALHRAMVQAAMWWHIILSASSSGVVERSNRQWGVHLFMAVLGIGTMYISRPKTG